MSYNYETLRRKHWGKFHDFGFGNGFFDVTSNIQSKTNKKIDKLEDIKIKNFYVFKVCSQQSEKEPYKILKSICKLYVCKGINIQICKNSYNSMKKIKQFGQKIYKKFEINL